jgi:hypothetical protein
MENGALIGNAAGLLVAVLLAQVLRWAAIQRARSHGEWAKRQQESRHKGVPVIDWSVRAWAVAACL